MLTPIWKKKNKTNKQTKKNTNLTKKIKIWPIKNLEYIF